MITLLLDRRDAQQAAGQAEGDDLWLPEAELEPHTGWARKPEGLCEGEVCVPIPRGQESRWVRGGAVNLAALWAHLGRPSAHDARGETWVFGAGAAERGERLRSLEAPDFTLPDLAGQEHRLSAQRGKRVFLVTWASW